MSEKTEAGNNTEKQEFGDQFFVPGAFLVKFGDLSGSQVATQNDTRV